jgi:hypothetical protein
MNPKKKKKSEKFIKRKLKFQLKSKEKKIQYIEY